MITLVATNELFRITTGSAASLDVYAAYNELAVPSLSSANPSSSTANISTATTVTIVGAPAAGYIRQIKGIWIVNKHASVSTLVTAFKEQAGAEYLLHPKFTLAPGEGACYIEGAGWTLYNATGTRKADA